MTSAPRSAFNPTPYILQAGDSDPPLTVLESSSKFYPIISTPSAYELATFSQSCTQLIEHPEYNSTLILRSETLQESDHDSDSAGFHIGTLALEGHFPVRQIHRRLVARRPGRDPSMEQLCTFYVEEHTPEDESSVVVLTPLRDTNGQLPYYHPDVSQLAFRFLTSKKVLRIEVAPSPSIGSTVGKLDAAAASASQPKLYRTCMHLLSTIHRFSPTYQKSVFHDRLVPRDVYQDVYLLMRERHGARCVGNWQEVTDPRKHVYEDIAIATYLILIWFYTYSTISGNAPPTSVLPKPVDPDAHRPNVFECWPRPPGGFLDLGCGNGLLTHILIYEGYAGAGVDIRARQSWDHYDPRTKDALHVAAVDPTVCIPGTVSSLTQLIDHNILITGTLGCFIIGNHADELTPWIPVLSRLWNASGYLSIPCCSWAWDSRWSRGYTDPDFGLEKEDEHKSMEETLMKQELNSLCLDDGMGGSASTYAQYRAWVARVSEKCGWRNEYDALRIPSTRNWAIVGRIKLQIQADGEDAGLRFARAVVAAIRKRGAFKTRVPEGNAGSGH